MEEHVLLFKSCLKKEMALTFDAHIDSQEHVPLTYSATYTIYFCGNYPGSYSVATSVLPAL